MDVLKTYEQPYDNSLMAVHKYVQAQVRVRVYEAAQESTRCSHQPSVLFRIAETGMVENVAPILSI